jgi:hypothetical protein
MVLRFVAHAVILGLGCTAGSWWRLDRSNSAQEARKQVPRPEDDHEARDRPEEYGFTNCVKAADLEESAGAVAARA